MADYKNFERVIRNVDKLNSQSMAKRPEVSAYEIQQYLNSEGYDLPRFTKAANNYAKAKGITSEYGLPEAAIQGIFAGFGDEAEALIKSLKNKKPYEQNLAAVQFAKEEYEQANPVKAAVAETIGSLPAAFALGQGAVKGAEALPKLKKAWDVLSPSAQTVLGTTAAGTVTGGLVGAGQAEQGQRLEGAKKGAQLGAFLSPLALGAGKVIGGVGSKVAEVTGVTDGVQAVVKATKDIPVVKSFTGKTAEFFGMTDDALQRRADTKIIQALQRDKMTLDEIKLAMTKIRESGYKPETIMEFGGNNTKKLGEVVALYPSSGEVATKLAEERKAGAGERILKDFQEAFKVNADPMKIADDVIAYRSSASKPLYDAAYAKPVSIGNGAIDNLMQDPSFQSAYARANRIATRDGFPLPELKPQGNSFDLKTIDYIKRGIDDEIGWSKTPASGLGKDEIRSLKDQRSKFMTEVDAQAPVEYKQARQTFSGATSVYDAIEEGKGFFNMDARQLKKYYDGLSPAEKDGFAVGAYDSIRTKIQTGGDGIDLVKRTFGSPEKRDQIKVLIGDDAFNSLESQIGREKAIRSTDVQITGSSRTEPRATARAEFEGETELVPQVANKGLIRGLTDYAIRSTQGTGARTAQQIAPELFTTDPATQAKLLDRLGLLDQFLREQALGGSVRTGVVGGSSQSLLD